MTTRRNLIAIPPKRLSVEERKQKADIQRAAIERGRSNCPDCNHPAHFAPGSGSIGCGAWVDNGWTRHGCHCTTTISDGA